MATPIVVKTSGQFYQIGITGRPALVESSRLTCPDQTGGAPPFCARAAAGQPVSYPPPAPASALNLFDTPVAPVRAPDAVAIALPAFPAALQDNCVRVACRGNSW